MNVHTVAHGVNIGMHIVYCLNCMGFAALYFAVTCLGMRLTAVGLSPQNNMPTICALGGLPALVCLYRLGAYCDRIWRRHATPSVMALLNITFMTIWCSVCVWAGGLIARYSVGEPMPGWFIGALAPFFLKVLIWLFNMNLPDYSTKVIRGTVVRTRQEVLAFLHATCRPNQRRIPFGGLPFPEYISSGHVGIWGAIGSGKTITLRLMMQHIIPTIRPGSDARCFIYDPKQEILEILSGLPMQCPVHLLNSFDERSAAWDIAKDVTTKATALQVASILIPESKGENAAFFTNAARGLLTGVILSYIIKKPGRWTLEEVFATLSDRELMEATLRQCVQTKEIANQYCSGPERLLHDILSTIYAHTATLQTIASLMAKASYKISLNDWIHDNSIIVLGNDDSLRAPMDAINRVIFQRITELLLSQSESDTRRSWFILDELKEAGRLTGLSRLLTKGRSKGCRTIIASQTIEGLRSVYGDNEADEIAGMVANKVFLRMDSPTTARWAADIIGKTEYVQWDETHNTRDQSKTRTQHFPEKDAVLPSDLLRLPPVTNSVMHGYYVSPMVGVFYSAYSFKGMLARKGATPNFVGRPPEDQFRTTDSSDADACDDEGPSLDEFTRMEQDDDIDYDN